MGHPGDDATDPLIDKAYAAGIIFTTANTALPKAAEEIWAGRHGLCRRA